MEDIYTVVGMSHGSFTDQTTNKEIRYAKLFATAAFTDAREGSDYHTKGEKAFSFSCVAPDVFANIEVGDEVELYFNQYKKVAVIKPVA